MKQKKSNLLFNRARKSQDEEQPEFLDPEQHYDNDFEPETDSVSDQFSLLAAEFAYLGRLIVYRLNRYFPSQAGTSKPAFPRLEKWQLPLARFVDENELSEEEATLLLIGLAPHVHPDLFDQAIESKLHGAEENRHQESDFPRIGGVRGKNSRSFLPTGETALFLLAGADWEKRLQVQQLFWADHLFARKKILWLEELPQGEPAMSGRMVVSQDYIDAFTYGKALAPHFSISFPAKQIHTDLTWDSLVINNELKDQINELQSWVKYNDQLMQGWGMQGRLKKGFRALFFGPAGTGKTFTAGLLGKHADKDVYKVDLSMVVSKYIGETEKNLELLFARAEDKGWILFFDEADALFGKRTSVRDAHDKYANQEVSYLLQRIEDYNGLVILATNMKNNIDDAFIRRFNAILKFPFPDAEQRALIWKKSLPQKALFLRKPTVDPLLTDHPDNLDQVNIPEAVKKYELTGGSILNVVHYAGLKAVERLSVAKEKSKLFVPAGEDDLNCDSDMDLPLMIYLSDVLDGIRRELTKEGKPFSL